MEPPQHLAGVRIIGADKPAYAEFRAAIADHDFATQNARGAGDRVGQLRVDSGRLPQDFAGRRIKRDQASVERADIDLALPDSHAPIDHVATGMQRFLLVDFRIKTP